MNILGFTHDLVARLASWADLDFWEAMFASGGLLFTLVVYRLHRSTGEFRFEQFFTDDNGKGSIRKLLGFGTFLVHSWITARYCVYTQLNDTVINLVIFYGLLWAGVLMLDRVLPTLADALAARFGLTKPSTPAAP